uniref:Intronic ORF at intron 1 of rnl n=1 Tax=Ceratocystis cacaofunesta TaxID=386457 RepID=M1F9A0_9PEZI|nr:intronic ORF at intron 1 of rnl [Ceratocystis cacaofunesta]AFO38136.1 intronic ORF at intron 1 of rnl [Ceratocystis cacaofunesta]
MTDNNNIQTKIDFKQNLFYFYTWFVGFSDAESNFSIVPKQDNKGDVNRFTFMFAIGLHLDDLDALNYIQSQLNIGVVRVLKDECKYVITKKEDIEKLMSIFDRFNLNTTKHLDYLDFKKAFNLYFSRENGLTEELKKQILYLKDSMNKKRTNFDMPIDHNIIITKSWLLGLIEGEGSFQLWRNDLVAVFSLVLTERQLPVLEKIKEFLFNDLDFDLYSKFKLNSSSAITINHQKARKNSKASVLFIIKNIYILNNYLVPYLENMTFITKKGKDFKDFKLICNLLYNGAHKNDEIKSLILKLSNTMNNFRLSTNPEQVESLNSTEKSLLVNASPLVKHLDDGRQIDLRTDKIIHQHSSSIYKVIKPNKDMVLLKTLFEAADIVDVDIRTLSKLLTVVDSDAVEVKGNLVKRIAVFFKNKK